MEKPGIGIDIPGFGARRIKTVVTDYTGTHSCGGTVPEAVRQRLRTVSQLVDLHVVTADSFGTADGELTGIAKPYHLRTARHDEEKAEYVRKFRLSEVAAFGNGNNDRLMLRAVMEGGGLAIAIDNGEGCATDAILNAHLFIAGAANALDLLLDPVRCKATLRF